MPAPAERAAAVVGLAYFIVFTVAALRPAWPAAMLLVVGLAVVESLLKTGRRRARGVGTAAPRGDDSGF